MDVSDISYFFLPGAGEGKSEPLGGGVVGFFLENPRRGGVSQGGGPRGREGLCGKLEKGGGGG